MRERNGGQPPVRVDHSKQPTKVAATVRPKKSSVWCQSNAPSASGTKIAAVIRRDRINVSFLLGLLKQAELGSYTEPAS